MGWKLTDGNPESVWITIPNATKLCNEMIKCSCNKSCSTFCKCKRYRLVCAEFQNTKYAICKLKSC